MEKITMNRRSNYEATKLAMEKHFLHYDQEGMIQKFSLDHDENFLYIRFLEEIYAVDRHRGRVYLHNQPVSYEEAMSIYDLLCCSKPEPKLSGTFEVLRGSIAGGPDGSLFHPKEFAGRAEALCRACEQLGGIPYGKGDASYILKTFDCLPIRLIYWEGDEDFEPALQFQWDRNVRDFLHFESTFYVTGCLITRLLEIMDTEKSAK